ncbi:uroporphyrinogen-III C-methyltransferase [Clostridium sp. Sa3CUN1]|uniref:uroporphyrinogen-III C-methyltransferase n=1 Tax=Clostridium gallinarum TaxID=2762246 RepID=A0ABR8Q3A2_9CLOT|nr:uroporphyrinogen-III C-methyltransferase [Clostridium gallinarum]MBD7914901.1 uroporphyrinogen-III C-methyltransferase [Clostridium gallinarum]
MSKVYIIGTGPGDEDLLTIKAVDALQKCTAVLYDRLVSNNILNYLDEKCIVYYCGKEPGSHYKTQEEINESLVKLAKEGHIVGRIKGGDPYVFGRGGEEVLALIDENIDFEVIPGITSPISVLNYAGIPITQRGMAQSFHIITGMTAGVLNINWEAVAKEKGTLVFMMGLNNLGEIIRNLVSNGKDEDTKVAVIMRGTSSKQKKVVGTIKDIEEKVEKAKLKSPCIIVMGDVVSLNDKLNWYENKPLFGSNICVTRSREQSSNLKKKLRDLGAEVTEINSIKIKSTNENLNEVKDKLGEYDHILLTSVNGVDLFFDYIIDNKIDIRSIKAKFSVVGKATRKALEKRGIQAFIMAREFVGEGLFNALKPYLKKGEKVLLPCSSGSRNYLKDEIESLGLIVDRVHTYDTICGEVKNKRVFDEVDFILYTSPSTVNNMISLFGVDKIKGKQNIAIGPQTFKALKENNVESHMCKKHSEDGFLAEIVEIYKLHKESKGE